MNQDNYFEIEKSRLVEKIQQRNAAIEQLINNNHRVRLLNSEQLSKIEDVYQKNKKFKQKLIDNEFEIAIVGLEKAGKSTFANALIKSNVLPSAPERCTFTSTRLVNGVDKAKVQFYTEEQFERIFQELLKEVGYISSDCKPDAELEKLKDDLLKIERGNILFSTEKVREDKIEKLKEEISKIKENSQSKNSENSREENKKLSFRNINSIDFENYFGALENKNPTLFKNHVGKTDEEIKDILKFRDRLILTGEIRNFSGEELKGDNFQSYIKGENQGKDTSRPRSVCSIEIESSELKGLDNAIVYDVPGFDSPTKIHMRQTEERLKSADAIILVTNVGTNPSLQGTTLSVITKNTDEDGIALRDKLFVFGNQLDRVNDASQLKGNVDILISDVEKYKIGERKRVFSGSAYKYLSDEKIISKAEFRFDIESGIDDIRNALIKYYETERFEILKRKIDTNHKLMQAVFDDVLDGINFDENFSEGTEQTKIAKSAYREVEYNLQLSLKKLQDKFKKEIYEQKYFTQKFHQLVDDESYFDEIDKESFELQRILNDDSVRLDLPISKINQKIRINIHKKYLENFTHLIKKMTDDKAREIEITILRSFVSAICGINLFVYDEIEPICKKYIDKIGHEVAHHDGSFTYLLERFSRDLFDVLLSSPVLSQDRVNRYKDSQKEFSYLDSYYSNGKGDLINIILIQKEQSLLGVGTFNSILDVVHSLRRVASNLAGQAAHVQALDSILKVLQNTNSVFFMKDADIDAILKQGKLSITDEQVLKEINEDIRNLKHILQFAVVPAANLELVFLNSIDKKIKRLIAAFDEKDSLYSDAWDDFISKIIPIVKKNDFDKINDRIEVYKLQKELLTSMRELANA